MDDEHLVRARSAVLGMVRLQLTANGLGVLVVLLYFWLLLPGPELGGGGDLNAVVFGTYLAVMLVVALPVNAALLHRAVRWVRENRAPGVRERKLLFSLPTAETASALVSWFGAAVLFGWINDDIQRVAVGIALAGVVTCTLLYLLLEGHFRPLFALALRNAELPEDRRDVGPRLMLAWILGSGVPLLAIAFTNLISPVPLDPGRLAWLATASALAGGVVMFVAARSVTRPVLRIRDGLRRIEQGDLDHELPIDDLGELGRLAEGVNHLAAGLREREELRDLFGRQVGRADLVELALSGNEGEQREVTVLFVDLRGYTRFAERHTPAEVVAVLNRFFGAVVAVVNREGGWVNKFEGDAALCIFGAPQLLEDHAARALRAARSLPRELEQGAGPLAAGIGVATGEVLAGFVGTPERFEYTVIGDVVNVAARLCEAAKDDDAGVFAAASSVAAAAATGDDTSGWESAGRIGVRGRSGRAEVFRPATGDQRRSRWPSIPIFGR